MSLEMTTEEKIRYLERKKDRGTDLLHIRFEKIDGRLVCLNPRTIGETFRWKTVKGKKEAYSVEDENYMVAKDYSIIKVSQCRNCKCDNSEKYSERYYEHFGYPDDVDFLYCWDNGFCQKCAIEFSEKIHSKFKQIDGHVLDQKYQDVCGDTYIVERHRNGDVVMYKKPAYESKQESFGF